MSTTLEELVGRFDPTAIDVPERSARIRLEVTGEKSWDAVIKDGAARLVHANGAAPDALLSGSPAVWRRVAGGGAGGGLSIRRNLNLGVGFLAATTASDDPARLRFRAVQTRSGRVSVAEAGTGDPLVALHGLGATKASFLPTIGELSGTHRVIAIDLPGFGDSDKPVGATYDAPWFARRVVDALDALEIDRTHLVGNSMGGRIALETGFSAPERVRRIVLLCPAVAWLRDRRFAAFLRLVRPELGLIQPTPRPVVDALVRRLVPGGTEGWAAAGVDEFLRSFTTPRGRAAFYAAARNIYLDEPAGESGFWTRLKALECDSLFVWGRHDGLVPASFRHHVEKALPRAEQLVLDCGHVPQLEAPARTHAALRDFLARR